jgi:hypothetical protein
MFMFFIVLGVMLLVVTLMSVGVLLGRKPIAGSCGGMKALGMDVACDICGGDKTKCENDSAKAAKSSTDNKDLASDAMAK